MSSKRLVPLPMLAAATAPTAGNTGDMYLNTTNNTIYVWNGSAWVTAYSSLPDPMPNTFMLMGT